MASNETPRPIRKRKKIVSEGAHHGGAWKVAYADFVTAMMAFFLLMWLLNSTTEDQRKGLADYFTPTIPVTRTSAGGNGMLSGVTIFAKRNVAGIAKKGETPKAVRRDPAKQATRAEARNKAPATAAESAAAQAPALPGSPAKPSEARTESAATGPVAPLKDAAAGASATRPLDVEAVARAAAEKAEREKLENIGRRIAAAVDQAADGALQRHFLMRMTPEGLVIELVDAADQPLFASASAAPAKILGVLLDVLVPVLGTTLNGIAVVGHTDAVPFGGKAYSNWELSADRANAARRMLAARGLPDARIRRVTGRAAVEPLLPGEPDAPQNRRISLTLLREAAR